MAKIAPKIRLFPVAEDAEPIELFTGAFAQISAKRRFGLEPVKQGDPEAVMWACWIELRGVPKHTSPRVVDAQFDEFLKEFGDIEFIGDDDETEDGEILDPTKADSSASLLDSPPTPGSTPQI